MLAASSLATLAALGLVLGSAWYNFTRLHHEQERLERMQGIWEAGLAADAAPAQAGQLWCVHTRRALHAPFCSLWTREPSGNSFHRLASDALPGSEVSDELCCDLLDKAWRAAGPQQFRVHDSHWLAVAVLRGVSGGEGGIVLRLPGPEAVDAGILGLACSVAGGITLRTATETELVRTRRQLDDARADLLEESRLAAVGRLAAGVAHELNTPLGAVLTMVGSLSRKLDDPDIQKRLSIVRDGVVKCKGIIEKLLVFSRGSSSEQAGLTFTRFVRSPVSLNKVVEESVALLAESLAADGVTVEIDCSAIPDVFIHATQWGQVVTNLVVNARDALRDAGSPQPAIRIKTWASASGQVHLQVTDNGPGITESIRPHIFDPFFTTKDIGKGTGLGLAIVREIVRKHEGAIEVLSTQSGAAFLISLPAAPRRSEASTP